MKLDLKSNRINFLPSDGYVVFPLSISRLRTGQSPKKCFEFIKHLDTKINIPGNDIIFIYTDGLYHNSSKSSFSVRKYVLNETIVHRNLLVKLINNYKKWIPSAFHFLNFDYVTLSSKKFFPWLNILDKEVKENLRFRLEIQRSLGKRNLSEENVRFIIEELTVAHIIRQQKVIFPKTLVREDKFRLVVYPGPPIPAEEYIWKNKVLPIAPNSKVGRYGNAYYNPVNEKLYRFDYKESYSFKKL